MNSQDQNTILEYVYSFDSPVEQSFFTDKQLSTIKDDKTKLESSRTFVSSVINTDNFEEVIQKAILEGRIFTPSQMANVDMMVDAIEYMDGDRLDIQETLVSKSGQRLIMSRRLQEILGFLGDEYMTLEELDQLTAALQIDGVPGPEVDRVVSSMHKFGAVLLQRGVFVALKSLLDEAVGHRVPIYTGGPIVIPEIKPAVTPAPAPVQQPAPVAPVNIPIPLPPKAPVIPVPAVKPVKEIPVPAPQPSIVVATPTIAKPKPINANLTAEELPLGFIEYAKHQDSNYQQIEQQVIDDPKFKAFFEALKKHYKHYQTMTVSAMAHEIMIRPALWIKLSSNTQTELALLLERHLPAFKMKIAQIAQSAHAEKLNSLKQDLNK